MHRRAYLKRAGIAALAATSAGCSESLFEGQDDGNEGIESSRRQVVDSRAEVAEGSYRSFSFELTGRAVLSCEFTVLSGPAVEIFVVSDREFNDFRTGKMFRSHTSETGTNGTDTAALEQGSYRLLIDNTYAGDLNPPASGVSNNAEVKIDAWTE